MLSTQMVGMLITSGVVGAVLGFLVGIPYLKKKGIDVTKVVDATENIIKTAEPIINLTSNLMPNNPAVNVLKIVETWGGIAAGYAQQLNHAGDIKLEERADAAESVVNAALKELGVEVDDNRKLLIDAAIKDITNKFGHAEPTEAQKQAQLQQLQTENASLKTAITQFNANTSSTVQPVIQAQ